MLNLRFKMSSIEINQYTRVDYIYTSPLEQVKFSNQYVKNVPCSYNIINLQEYTEISDQSFDSKYVVKGNVLMKNCTLLGEIEVTDGSSLYILGGVMTGITEVVLGNNSMAILTDGSNLDFISEIYPVSFYGSFVFQTNATEPAYGFIAGQMIQMYNIGHLDIALGGERNVKYDVSKIISVDADFNFYPLYIGIPSKTVDYTINPPVNIIYRFITLET